MSKIFFSTVKKLVLKLSVILNDYIRTIRQTWRKTVLSLQSKCMAIITVKGIFENTDYCFIIGDTLWPKCL